MYNEFISTSEEKMWLQEVIHHNLWIVKNPFL